MTVAWRTVLVAVPVLLAALTARLEAQPIPPPDDSRQSLLREAMLGLLTAQPRIPETRAQHDCLTLPVDPPNDRLQGPHGDSLISSRCDVIKYEALTTPRSARWTTARYRWTSVFTAEDATRGPAATDPVIEEEVVLFDGSPPTVRPVWHARFETGAHAIWRSVTPELAPTGDGQWLLSVMSCVNGTGGCGQEFLRRHADGRWFGVRQVWLDQLPPGFTGRIRHGVRIEPTTLRGEAGFYGDRDANCCPTERLIIDLALKGDTLALRRHAVVKAE